MCDGPIHTPVAGAVQQLLPQHCTSGTWMDGTTGSGVGASDAVLPRTWANAIPLKVQLSPDNVTSPTRPQPFYILVSRQAFLCSVASQAWPYFQHVLPHLPGQQGLRPWFDHQQLPLRGNIPIGVLHDLLCARRGAESLPWELTIHYTGMPDVLAGWHNGLPMHTQFFHSLKEACFICKGPDGAAAVMKMNGASQDAMWAAIERGEVQKYAAAVAALRVTPSERQNATPALPVRLLVRAVPGHSDGSAVGFWEDVFMTSRPVTAQHADAAWCTLGQALQMLLPGVMFQAPSDESTSGQSSAAGLSADAGGEAERMGASGATSAEHASEASGAGDSAGGSFAVAQSEASEAALGQQPQVGPVQSSMMGMSVFGSAAKPSEQLTAGGICEAVVAGVVPPLATPIAWLHANLHAPDYFLYIAVRRCSGMGAGA